MDTRAVPHRRQQTHYLVLYNLVCAVLWTAVFGRVILLIPLVGFENVAGGVGTFTKWTQTIALLEVVHSALGIPFQQFLAKEASHQLLAHLLTLFNCRLGPRTPHDYIDAGLLPTPTCLGSGRPLS